jgi:hypothetical protein
MIEDGGYRFLSSFTISAATRLCHTRSVAFADGLCHVEATHACHVELSPRPTMPWPETFGWINLIRSGCNGAPLLHAIGTERVGAIRVLL